MVALAMKVPLKAGHRNPPSCPDLDCRRKLAGAAEAIERVGMYSDPPCCIGHRDQIGSGHRQQPGVHTGPRSSRPCLRQVLTEKTGGL
jgi:hypothetical protein